MEHKKVYSHQSRGDSWTIKCSCGRSWNGWRWLVEEQFTEHIPTQEPEPKRPLWFDDESYARYQSDPGQDDPDNPDDMGIHPQDM